MAENIPVPIQHEQFHQIYINQVFGRFLEGLGLACKNKMFPRAKEVIVSTYEKQIEVARNRRMNGGEKWSPKYPFVIIDPVIDMEPDPQVGRFFHGYPNFMQKFAHKMYGPDLYKDNNIHITPVLNRYRGSFDIHVYASSIYEMIDEKVFIHQFFGGYMRPIYPFLFESIITIPDKYEDFRYVNPYTGEDYYMDWDSSDNSAQVLMLRDIAKELICFPVNTKPFLYLSSVSDAADKYGGGGDIIGQHHLIASVEWECAIPTHLIVKTRFAPIASIPMEVTIPTAFKNIRNPISRESIRIRRDIDSVAWLDTSSTVSETLNLVYKNAVAYVITQEDIDILNENGILEIDIGETLIDERYMYINCPAGWLDRDTAWRLKTTDKSKLELVGIVAKQILEKDDVLSLIIYKQDPYDETS